MYKAPGALLELVAYNRAELRTSDHKPVYALFRATVRVIDHAKKAALARALTEGVTATAPGETLDEKLATLTLESTGDSERACLDFQLTTYADDHRSDVAPPSKLGDRSMVGDASSSWRSRDPGCRL